MPTPVPFTPSVPGAAARRGWSLRVRLTLLTAGLLAVALAAGAVALTGVLSRGRVAALDEVVRARALTVAELATAGRLPDALPVAQPGEIVQVLDADGRVVASSTTASRTLPVLPPAETAALARAAREARDARDAPATADEPLLVTTTRSAYDDDARAAVLPLDDGTVVVATAPLTEVRGLLHALRLALLGVVPAVTALLGAGVWLALGRALRPVEALRSAAAQVARTGGPGALPVPRADDEIGALARTLNEMLDRLEVAAARQRGFVADAAHELRSPLAALVAGLDVARAHPAAYPQDELVADLTVETRRMQALVDDLLLLARVGSRPAVREPVDLGPVVRDAADLALTASGRTEVRVGTTGTGRALGDAVALGRVVRNLLDNAVRHATAEVRVTVADGRVVVEDDGPGVPADQRERVFERFVRLDDARARPEGGSGLGLAIAREVAREHGGDVRLTATDGGGLRATLTLPVS
ncbi:MAG TPA: HAMP domain-containing sensor histidine kinase [Cellulomonas sp.]